MNAEERIKNLQTALIQASLREAARVEGITDDSVIQDILLHGRSFEVADDGQIYGPSSLSPEAWLKSMRSTRSHWFGAPAEEKKPAAFPDNPFSREHWNATRQGMLVRDKPELAERMAKAAGVKIGQLRPK